MAHLLENYSPLIVKIFRQYSDCSIPFTPDASHEKPLLSMPAWTALLLQLDIRTAPPFSFHLLILPFLTLELAAERILKLSFVRAKVATSPCVDYFQDISSFERVSNS